MSRLADGLARLRTLVRIAYEAEIRYPAAALAYYAFVSFAPFLLLVFAVAGEQLTVELSRTAPQFLTPRVQRLVDRSLATASGRTGAGVLSAIVLGWTAVNTVGDIRTVVERVEGSIEQSLSCRIRDAGAILASLSLALLAVVLTSLFFEFPPAGPLGGLGGFVVLWAALAVAFVPLYYVPSGVVSAPVGALPGAAAASLGWTLLHTVVQFYAGHAGQYAIYGVLSSVIVLLTTLYLAAALLLVGVIVNAEVATGSAVRTRRL